MLKPILLFLIVAAAAILLSGCSPWGCWDGPGHRHSSHSHDRGCGHHRY